ncbi:MAG: glycogen synthase GlgA [Myxococcota bacterium]|nr:glycogen synthase GlgA [Myxococcota bacterium]MDW8363437.1 glycogen synthase GlgA [Myxococcales bacterium]
MRVAFVAAEVAPWCRTGGLGEAVTGLAHALVRRGVEVHVMAPLYRECRRTLAEAGVAPSRDGAYVELRLGGRRLAGLFRSLPWQAGRPHVHLLEHDAFFDREGPYGPPGGGAYDDNPVRFAFLSAASLEAGWALCGLPPDVWHAHDWHAALLPAHRRRTETHASTPVVLTVHNVSFQGIAPRERLEDMGLDASDWHWERYEHYDHVNPLKGGIALADAIVAPSPSHARELLEPAGADGLDAVFRAHADRLHGILNGIDTEAWNPATDPYLPARYDARDPSGKTPCRDALCAELGLEPPASDEPVFAVVSRLTWHKGVDWIADVLPGLLDRGARAVILGRGERALEERLRALAAARPSRLAMRTAFDVGLAHRIFAGADLFLMPSRFEPCGLAQMQAMRYGTPPVARAVGGLRDTVVDATPEALAQGLATGVLFDEPSAHGLWQACERAWALWRDHPWAWRRMMQAGMQRDFGWDGPAAAYHALYDRLVRASRARRGLDDRALRDPHGVGRGGG